MTVEGAEFDLDMVDRLLTTTRAVRPRLDLQRPVPADVVRTCLEIAVQAPTAADQQHWRWVVVTDPEVRSAIAERYRARNEAFVRGRLDAAGAGPERRRMESVLHLVEHLHEVPVLVAAYVVAPTLGGVGDGPVPDVLLYGSIFAAAWSFQLALRSRGLGTVPLYVAETALAEVVGAPADARLACLLPVAYTTGTTFRRAQRRPLEEVVGWNHWNGQVPAQPDAADEGGASGAPGPVLQLRLVVEVEDLDTTVAFYRDALGLPERAAFSGEGDARVVILDAGGATLELANRSQQRMVDRVEVGRDASPRLRVAFEVPDAAAAVDALTAAGAELIGGPVETPWRSVNARLEAPADLQLTIFEELETIEERRTGAGFATHGSTDRAGR